MLSRSYALWRNIFRRRRLDQELDDELQSYIELVAAEKRRRGVPAEQAYREARLEFESVARVKEEVRDVRAGAAIDTLVQDIRYAFRVLARNASFSAIVLLTLALGIGANTAIFTVVSAVLLKPLPYPEPDRVVMIWERHLTDGTLGTVAPANFYDWHQQNRSFEKMAAMDPYPDYILNGAGKTQRLLGANVSAEFFSLLGVRMALGRDFLPQEDRPGNNRVVILSYSAWQHLGGRRDIAGTPLRLNNAAYTVIGVLPRDFSLVRKSTDFQARVRFEVWTPLALSSPPEARQRGTHPLSVFGRLKPGVPLRQAQADLDLIAANLQHLYPQYDKDAGITAVPLAERAVENVRTALLTLLAAVAMVLLIACANIANLQLTRAATRAKEIALRIALGASRKRIARQLLTESLVLAAAGGLLGLTLAYAGVPALVMRLPADVPRTSEITVDSRVLLFTVFVSLLTGVVFGLVPLIKSRRISANDSLKESGRALESGQSRVRSVLIVGQVAVALVLLMGAGLMTKSFWKLLQVSPGFRTEHILTARLSLPPQYTNGYAYGVGKHRRISSFERTLEERVLGIPGVKAAAFSAYLPLSGTDNSWGFDVEGSSPKPGEYDVANYRPVTEGYFETMGIPIDRGRGFGPGEDEDAPLVVVINETMARKFWSAQNPIGQRLRFSGHEWRTIIGIAADVHHVGLNTKPEPELYLPYAQAPNVEARPTIVVRTSIPPQSVINSLREAVAAVDPGVPVDQIETMKQIVYGSVGQSRFRTALVAAFALLALFVASIGLYGVMSYLVNQRTREFGIRMAVGASRGAVLRVVLGEAAKLVGIGIGVGLMGAAASARLIASLLFGVAPFDLWALGGASILLAAVAIAGSYVPARRAANADPMDSLRYE